MEEVTALGNGDVEMFEKVNQPVFINGNAYLKGAPAFAREEDNYLSEGDPQVKISVEGDSVYLEMNVEKDMLSIPTEIIDTENWEWSALWKRRLTILMEIRLYWIRIILEKPEKQALRQDRWRS